MLNRILCGLVLVVAASLAQAQTIPASVTLNWTLPSTNTDGTSIATTGPLALSKVQVWLSSSTIPLTTSTAPTAEITPVGVTTTQTIQVAPGGTIFARIKVCNASVCGAFTNEVTKVVTVPTPGVPTNVTITIKIG